MEAVAKKKIRKTNDNQRLDATEVAFKILAYTFITIFALFCLYPLIYSLSCAISGYSAMSEGKVVLFPMDVQWGAFREVFTMRIFWIGYSNTLFVTLYGTIYCMVLSILGAYALSKKRLFGNKVFNFLLVFTMWFAAGTIPVYLNYITTRDIMVQSMGISDQKWVIVLAMGMSAFNVILLRNAFDSVPSEIEEAAVVDGANDFQIMSKIFVPMSKATIATVALFFAISRWNGYFWAFKVVSLQYDMPLQVIIQQTLADYASNDSGIAVEGLAYSPLSVAYAMIVCAIIPILIIYPFIQKYFAAGVTMGGVKE